MYDANIVIGDDNIVRLRQMNSEFGKVKRKISKECKRVTYQLKKKKEFDPDNISVSILEYYDSGLCTTESYELRRILSHSNLSGMSVEQKEDMCRIASNMIAYYFRIDNNGNIHDTVIDYSLYDRTVVQRIRSDYKFTKLIYEIGDIVKVKDNNEKMIVEQVPREFDNVRWENKYILSELRNERFKHEVHISKIKSCR